jgi:hypothetical protein
MAAAEQEILKIERKRTPGFWDKWAGKEIVIQTKGRMIITGIFRESREGFVILDKPVIKGVKKNVRPTEVMVDRHQIGHFHEVCPVEDVE